MKLQQSLETNLRKSISADYENQVNLLTQNNKDNEEKLKLARQKELEFLQKNNRSKPGKLNWNCLFNANYRKKEPNYQTRSANWRKPKPPVRTWNTS
ncbi:hypothetical protein [Paraflavitalea speifideaquila]|uniref:hypothetical protein n=1 Tax=Paraflavitalea speifideaquila TaxID=3076558 RepID=UPI0028E637AA|nr:hypothetical protein [Paraflavitalea speifideiaquila]